MACCVIAMRRPLYVAAESYKFARAFPLGQRDAKPTDYTPDFIELLFTDLGALTPAARTFDRCTSAFMFFGDPSMVPGNLRRRRGGCLKEAK